jgi:hypothetical protein
VSSPDDPIRDYIRANMRTMTREAIRDRLAAAGHNPNRVEEIWEQEWTGVVPASTAEGLWTTAIVLLIIGGLVGGAGVLLLLGLVSSGTANAALFVGLFAVGYLGIGLAIAWAVRAAARRWHISGGWALVIGILLIPVYGALMFGTCAAAASVS